ncbi:MAG: dihydroorotate dehydrogenase [Candidatus Brockarchaeota archaeon]|nr:dihydroorotate dehydrogenase [Candidatus Brockarchaeota archaeon]
MKRAECSMHPGMEVEVAGLVLRSPLMVASGVLGSSPSLIRIIATNPDVGAVVTKTVTYRPRTGYENPTVVDLGYGFLNAMGLPNPGYSEYRFELGSVKKSLEIPLIVSIGPSDEGEAEEMVEELDSVADGFEVNLSCPHVENLGMEVGSDASKASGIVKAVRGSTGKPVLVKISPNVTDFVANARSAVEAGADAITAINTVRGMAIDVNAMRPVLSNVYGGLSGKAIHPVAVRIVFELYEKIKAPIVGCGGVYDWRDAVELILAGATAVQIGSAIAHSQTGLKVFNEIGEGVRRYLALKGFSSVKQIIGLAHSER